MTTESQVTGLTSELIKNFAHSRNTQQFIKDLQMVIEKEGTSELCNAFIHLLKSVNDWKIEDLKIAINELSSRFEEPLLKSSFKILQNTLLLLLLDTGYQKSPELKLKIEILRNKIPLLEDALTYSKQIGDEILIKQFLEAIIDNNTLLGLLSLYGEHILDTFTLFSKVDSITRTNPDLFPAKSSFNLRLLVNLLLKIRNNGILKKRVGTILQTNQPLTDCFQLSFKYLERAKTIDERAADNSSLALDYYNLALLYYEQKRYKEAVHEIKMAQQLHEEQANKTLLLNDIILLGLIIDGKNQKDNALDVFNQALAIALEMDNKNAIAQLNLLISYVLRDQHKFEDGLKNLRTALVIFKQENVGSYLDLIDCYTGIGSLLRFSGKSETAKGFLVKILEAERQSGNTRLLSELHIQLALTQFSLNNEAAFQENYQQALSLSQQLKDPFPYAYNELHIGLSLCNTQSFQEGITHLAKALQLFYELEAEEHIVPLIETFITIYGLMEKPDLVQKLSGEDKNPLIRAKMILDQHSALTRAEAPIATPKLPSPMPIATVVESKSAREAEVTLPVATVIEPTINDSKTSPPPPDTPTATHQGTPESKTPSQDPPSFVGRQCPHCNFLVIDPEFLYCPKCATKLNITRRCANCNFIIDDPSFQFCPKCAKPL